MSGKKYNKEHIWLELDGDCWVVGVTDYAQRALGDVVHVEPAAKGSVLGAGKYIAAIESVKAYTEVYVDFECELLEVNTAVLEHPSLVNKDPLGAGWLSKIKISNVDEFNEVKYLNASEYAEYIKQD